MSSKIFRRICLALLMVLMTPSASAVVMYDEGREIVDGIVLLRDKEFSNDYYYLPDAPSVVIDKLSGKPKISLVKFVDPKGDTSGGLIHFLFSLDLPPERVEAITAELQQKVPGAKVKGPVPLRAEGDEETGGASFSVISSTVTQNTGGDSFTSSLVSSGIAPVTPGSQAAVAARLNQHGATLLWESLRQPISDISVAINASYEAALPAYRGKVFAEIETVYEHMFKIFNSQQGYSKSEVRKQVDEMVREGVIEVDITDRAGLDVDASQLSGIMNLVTDKLVNMLFDTSQGLSALPEQQKVPANVVEGRQKRGFLGRLFAGSGNQKYITDNQYTMREKRDVKRGTFSMVFTQNTTIRVPFNSAGNISGLYDAYANDETLFRVVALNDAAFQKRAVFFEIDPAYYQAFQDNINSVSVTFTKAYPGKRNQADFTDEVLFNQNDVKQGTFSKSLVYPRLGLKGADWTEYEFRTLWSFRGGATIGIPAELTKTQSSSAPSISLSPPAGLTRIEVDGDAASMVDAQIRRAMVEFEYRLLGESKSKSVALLPQSEEILKNVSLLHDDTAPIRYRVRWYGLGGVSEQAWQVLEAPYLFLLPPTDETG
ncbi:hypothetical protein GCM10008090_29480 [Arenicella chitinivorans]|uniref:Uncharacterized protein n=1 Tax=Arenicella chitinivorans TaxID=1329800 RepID=A0A918S2M9_9GAMM|nr:hypothetical protein [Arenicella chitinivorans]GHA17872.1 hypothetical protein GCM10008090_29480 [Arenicella chitinivorans]